MKQSLKHTPGPWMIAEPEFGSNKTYVVTCEHEDEPTLQVLVQDCSLEQSRKMSNARLIAAAPEMLEALERITKLIETDNLIESHGRLMGSYLEACQAIEKARGES